MNDEQYETVTRLLDMCQPIEVFELDGVLFLGYWPEVVKAYVNQNTDTLFYVWVHDHYTILTKEKNKK